MWNTYFSSIISNPYNKLTKKIFWALINIRRTGQKGNLLYTKSYSRYSYSMLKQNFLVLSSFLFCSSLGSNVLFITISKQAHSCWVWRSSSITLAHGELEANNIMSQGQLGQYIKTLSFKKGRLVGPHLLLWVLGRAEDTQGPLPATMWCGIHHYGKQVCSGEMEKRSRTVCVL